MNRPNQPTPKPANESAMPALGMTSKDLPDRLRPEVVDIEVLAKLPDMPSAAPSDGTGTSGNIKSRPEQQQASPPATSHPPQQL
jgi:hypothetical protein